jgi:SPP1 gp7 family putative phage head morphogenesis protein
MPISTEDELLQIILQARSVEYAYNLGVWSDQALKPLLSSLRQAQNEILTYLDSVGAGLTEWSEARSLALLDHFQDLTIGVRSVLGHSITEIVSLVGANALLMHNDILSFGGRVELFNNVSMTAAQLKSFIVDTKLGGKVMQEWVDSVYSFNIQEQIKQELFTGALKGESYPELVDRIREGFGIAEKDAINLTRTYVQTANVGAQEAVANENKDIIEGLKWTATLETSFKKSGRGVCIRCASLDGTVFKLDEPHPEIPLHHICRCCWVYVTIPWRKLGIDIDEMESAYRPWTHRPEINIGTGRKGKILDHGFHQGDYSSWMKTQSDRFQKNVLGPRRFELYDAKLVDLKGFVDQTTGKLINIKDLKF